MTHPRVALTLTCVLAAGCTHSTPAAQARSEAPPVAELSQRPAAPHPALEGPLTRASTTAPPTSVTVLSGPGGAQLGAMLTVDQDRALIRWHPGTVVPGAGGWPSADHLTAADLPTVLATFNGGFTNAASRGGIRAGNHQHAGLRPGAASLVIDGAGRADVVAYDAARGNSYTVVRQNLELLVDQGKAAATVGQDDSPVWGRTLHHRHATNRTAVGVTSRGSLIVVVTDRVTTRQLAGLLLDAGAVRAMELDINPQYSFLYIYTHSAGQPEPRPALPTQQGSPSRYLTASTRDFFSVEMRRMPLSS